MSPEQVAISVAALCGLVMVVGGIVLLYRGTITLDKADQGQAVTLEFKKLIRVQTSYPALGLFVIGLAFVIVSIHYAGGVPVRIGGRIIASTLADMNQVTIAVAAGPWPVRAGTDGQIDEVVYPNLQRLHVDVVMPGHTPRPWIARLACSTLSP